MKIPKLALIAITIFFFSGCNQTNFSANQLTNHNTTPLNTYLSTDTKFTPAFINDNQSINNTIINSYPDNTTIRQFISQYTPYLDTENHFIWQQNDQNKIDYTLQIKLKQTITPAPDQTINLYHLSTIQNYLVISTSPHPPTIETHPENSFLTIHSLDISRFQPSTISDINLIAFSSYLPLSFYYQNNQIIINHPNWPISPSHTTFNHLDYSSLNFLEKFQLNQIINQSLHSSYLTINQFSLNTVTAIDADDNHNLIFHYSDSATAQETFTTIGTTLKLQSTYSNQTSQLPDNTTANIFSPDITTKIPVTITTDSISYPDQNDTTISLKLDNNQITVSQSDPFTSNSISIISSTYLSTILPSTHDFINKFKSLQFQITNHQINGYLVK